MQSKAEKLGYAAASLAGIFEALAPACGIDFDPEKDLPKPDARKQLAEMNPDTSRHASLAGSMLRMSGMGIGQAKYQLSQLEKLAHLDIHTLIAYLHRVIENEESEREQLYEVIREANRAHAERAERAAENTPEKLAARIAELEKKLESKGGNDG